MFNTQLKDALAKVAKLRPEEALISDSITKTIKPTEVKTVIEKPKQKIKGIKR